MVDGSFLFICEIFKLDDFVQKLEQQLAQTEELMQKTHLEVAVVNYALGNVYREQGKYGDAEKLYKKALDIEERVLGEGHPDTATSYNNLVGLYDVQGKYKEAEELHRKASAIWSKMLE